MNESEKAMWATSSQAWSQTSSFSSSTGMSLQSMKELMAKVKKSPLLAYRGSKDSFLSAIEKAGCEVNPPWYQPPTFGRDLYGLEVYDTVLMGVKIVLIGESSDIRDFLEGEYDGEVKWINEARS